MKTLRLACLVVALILSTAVKAQVERYSEGTHFSRLETPARTSDPAKIEVLEIFWYGCPACFNFEPLIKDWVSKAPADVNFERFPAVFNELMKIHAQIFFTAQSLGIQEQIHDTVSEALVIQRQRLQSEQQIINLFSDNGVSAADASKAFNSFSVRTRVNRAESLTSTYKPKGTPSMVVNGTYVISIGGAVTSQQEMLKIVDFLIEKERRS